MSAITSRWTAHRTAARGRREIAKAIQGASAETVRLELLAIASRTGTNLGR